MSVRLLTSTAVKQSLHTHGDVGQKRCPASSKIEPLLFESVLETFVFSGIVEDPSPMWLNKNEPLLKNRDVA